MQTIPRATLLTLLFLLFPYLTLAQFGQFFEHMFSGGGGGGGGGRHHQEDVASDASWYKKTYEGATCSKYLCPGTLSCVDKPTHCPCAFPDHEEKYELHPDGLALCLTKSIGGAKPVKGRDVAVNEGWEEVRERMRKGGLSDTERKILFARKGLL